MRKGIAGVLIAALLIGLSQGAFAATEPEPQIRIGVSPQVEAGTVGATGPFRLIDKATGSLLYAGQANEGVAVHLGG